MRVMLIVMIVLVETADDTRRQLNISGYIVATDAMRKFNTWSRRPSFDHMIGNIAGQNCFIIRTAQLNDGNLLDSGRRQSE